MSGNIANSAAALPVTGSVHDALLFEQRKNFEKAAEEGSAKERYDDSRMMTRGQVCAYSFSLVMKLGADVSQ